MLDGTGDDHLSVGVKLPNGKSFFPIPSEMIRLRKFTHIIPPVFVPFSSAAHATANRVCIYFGFPC